MTVSTVTVLANGPARDGDEYVPRDVLKFILGTQVWLLGIAPFLNAVSTVRYYDAGYTASIAAGHASGAARLVAQITGKGVALLALLGLLAVLPRIRFDQRTKSLALGFTALAGSSVLAALLGTKSTSMMGPLTLLIIGATWYAAPAVDLPWLARHLTAILRLYTVGSLVAALVAPGWAIERGYSDSILPGVDFRLHGLATHANNLAPLILLGLIVSRLTPRPGPMARIWTGMAWVALVLTQSRTTLLAAGAIVLVEWFRRSRGRERNVRLVADVLVMAGAVVLVAFVWRGGAVGDVVGGDAGLNTLQARQDVWDVTLELWRDNPIFGYGNGLWGTDMRLTYYERLGWAAPHAHNQVVQTLGEAGLVGSVALLYYLIQLLRISLRHAVATDGASLAVVMLVLVRSVAECPLSRADIILLLSTFIVLLTIARSFPAPPEAGAQQPRAT